MRVLIFLAKFVSVLLGCEVAVVSIKVDFDIVVCSLLKVDGSSKHLAMNK